MTDSILDDIPKLVGQHPKKPVEDKFALVEELNKNFDKTTEIFYHEYDRLVAGYLIAVCAALKPIYYGSNKRVFAQYSKALCEAIKRTDYLNLPIDMLKESLEAFLIESPDQSIKLRALNHVPIAVNREHGTCTISNTMFGFGEGKITLAGVATILDDALRERIEGDIGRESVVVHATFYIDQLTIRECVESANAGGPFEPWINFCLGAALFYSSDAYVIRPDNADVQSKREPRAIRKMRQRNTLKSEKIDFAHHGKTWYADNWDVRGHLRLQPYGPGRTKRRLVFIPPHQRYRKATKHE